jgi:hypothetical protein
MHGFWILLAGLNAALAAGPAVGKAISLNGEVFLTLKGGADRKPLNPGDPLGAGDVVETLQASSARLLLPDASVMDLGPVTRFRVEAFDAPDGDPGSPDRSVGTAVDFGRVRTSVNKKLKGAGKFLMHTPSSVLAVRGTEFVVDAAAARSRTLVTVSDGNVEVATASGSPKPGSTVLSRGHEISVVAEMGLGRIGTVSPAQLSGLLGRSRVEDHTFTQGVVVGDIRTRFRGASTLALARTAISIPKLSVPRTDFAIPGMFTPNAQLIGVQQNIASETVTVSFGKP